MQEDTAEGQAGRPGAPALGELLAPDAPAPRGHLRLQEAGPGRQRRIRV